MVSLLRMPEPVLWTILNRRAKLRASMLLIFYRVMRVYAQLFILSYLLEQVEVEIVAKRLADGLMSLDELACQGQKLLGTVYFYGFLLLQLDELVCVHVSIAAC